MLFSVGLNTGCGKPNFARSQAANSGRLMKALQATSWLVACLFPLLFARWVYINGIGLSPDSTHYLFHSVAIYHQLDFLEVQTVWPPGYQTLLAIGKIFKASPELSACIIVALALATIFVFINKIMINLCINAFLRIIALLLLATNIGFLYVFQMAWSEVPFTAYSVLFIYFLIKHSTERDLKFFALACVFASLAALTRYIGYYSFILLGVYLITYLHSTQGLFNKQSLRYYLCLLLSVIPSIMWVLRNYGIDKTLHGPRVPSLYSFTDNLSLIVDILHNDVGRLVILLAVFVFLVFLLGVFQGRNSTHDASLNKVALALIVGLLALYISLVIYTASTAKFDKLNTRFFSSTYPFVVLLLAFYANSILKHKASKSVTAFGIKGLAYTLLLSILVGQVLFFSSHVSQTKKPFWHTYFGFYNSANFKTTRAWFTEVLDRNDTVKLYVLTDPKANRANKTTFTLSRSIAFRAKLFKKANNLQYLTIRDGLLLRFDWEEKNKSIEILPVSNVNTLLKEHLKSIGNGKLFIIVDDRNFKRTIRSSIGNNCRYTGSEGYTYVECN